ncbi:uncharacterized protein L969DRAFT_53001 [Mixia osmundae IAM 14324]|uniref:PH domain-containing protein n=1 Tax=Mixia osmundae (strain CBS 9802 / IAM 14324 / JCM 22182 / KY 12970) TaxID=764103 RepID=G7DUZ9_MIXOS|nr:uncharacterized protein L969DRAFT_53001 [Mixia osmundae IAM 14324]KEI37258.1 hypothetical protein L969DRAFT_53001 [Mixia osmundae IAM 14324]GAA94409.1 hypothetical protein E5Q_01061 [Mixia osmundae IAM 14324]
MPGDRPVLTQSRSAPAIDNADFRPKLEQTNTSASLPAAPTRLGPGGPSASTSAVPYADPEHEPLSLGPPEDLRRTHATLSTGNAAAQAFRDQSRIHKGDTVHADPARRDGGPSCTCKPSQGGLRRVFLGPHLVNTMLGHSAQEVREARQEQTRFWRRTIERGKEGKRLRLTRRLKRHLATGSDGAAREKQTAGEDSWSRWKGGSFEIGADIRAAAEQLRQDKLRDEEDAEREHTNQDHQQKQAASNAQKDSHSDVDHDSDLLALLHPGKTANSTDRTSMQPIRPQPVARATNATARTATSFQTARTQPYDASSFNPSITDLPATVRRAPASHCNRPPLRIDEDRPDMTFELFRTKSDLASSAASLASVQAHEASTVKGTHPQLHMLRKSRTVNFLPGEIEPTLSDSPPAGDAPPARVEHVLGRPDRPGGMEHQMLAFSESGLIRRIEHGSQEIITRTKMLVKSGWSIREDLPEDLNELSIRNFAVTFRPWEELTVVRKANAIECWSHYKTPFRERIVKHMKLRHIIPLKPGKTMLSLFSASDRIMCLTCSPQSKHEHALSSGKARKTARLHRYHLGTNVFILRTQHMSEAGTFFFQVWQALGGELPRQLDVHVPVLEATIRIPVPNSVLQARRLGLADITQRTLTRSGESYRLLTLKRVIDTTFDMLVKAPQWRALHAQMVDKGTAFSLAWHSGTILEWVARDPKAQGSSQGLEVLVGIPMAETTRKLHQLELRAELHYPTSVSMPDRTLMAEPAMVEGYVTRIKAAGTERLYISTHRGYLFANKPSKAHPPDPPFEATVDNPATLALAPFLAGAGGVFGAPYSMAPERQARKARWFSVHRWLRIKAATQNLEGEKVTGMTSSPEELLENFGLSEQKRSAEQIRRAKGYVDLRKLKAVRLATAQDATSRDDRASTTSQSPLVKDEAIGELAPADPDVSTRTFEIVTENDRVLRFQCYSRATAEEWVQRLSALVVYWARRQRVDALEQMPRPAKIEEQPVSALPELDESALSAARYNWCILQGCRGITLSGRLYHKAATGPFIERHVFLAAGQLVEFQLRQRDWQGQPTQTTYHRRKNVIDLHGCYIVVGRLNADLYDSNSSSRAQQKAVSRYYGQDGLVSYAADEDLAFVLYWKALGSSAALTQLTYQARSKAERDQWVFAIGAELERLRGVIAY